MPRMDNDVFATTYGVELLCARRPEIDREELARSVARWCPKAAPLDAGEEAPNLHVFIHPDHRFQLVDVEAAAQTVIIHGDKPPDEQALAPALQHTYEFPGARAAVGRSTHTVLVTDLMTSSLEAPQRLDVFQRALRGVLEVVRCEAIHWRPAGRIVDPAAWCRAFDEAEGLMSGFAGAIGVRMFRVDESSRGELVMDTLGLGALGLPDVQCHFYSDGLEPGMMARKLYDVGCYLLTNGDVIDDGHTIDGIDPSRRWMCQHEESILGPTRIVLDLNPGPTLAAGNR
jgi:hypothetical protein